MWISSANIVTISEHTKFVTCIVGRLIKRKKASKQAPPSPTYLSLAIKTGKQRVEAEAPHTDAKNDFSVDATDAHARLKTMLSPSSNKVKQSDGRCKRHNHG
jgi:hypothetical protein